MKKVAIILAAVAVVLMVAQAGMAADKEKGKGKKHAPGIRGKVLEVKELILTINTAKEGEDVTKVDVTTDAETKFSLDRKPATLAQITAGLFVFISPKDGTAKRVSAFTKMPTRGGKDGGKRKPKPE